MAKKPTKKDLEKEIKDLKHDTKVLREHRDTLNKRVTEQSTQIASLKEKGREAVSVIEMYKSAYLEATERVETLQERTDAIRTLISETLAETPPEKAKTPEQKETIIRKVIQKVCQRLVEMENKVFPFMPGLLPMPKILKEMAASGKGGRRGGPVNKADAIRGAFEAACYGNNLRNRTEGVS